MSEVILTCDTYIRLLQEDLDWLLKQPRTLERDHIEALIKQEIRKTKEYNKEYMYD